MEEALLFIGALLSLLACIAGVVGLLFPRAVRLHSRLDALSLFLSFIPLMGLVMLLVPDAGKPVEDDASVRIGGIVLIGIWILLASALNVLGKKFASTRPDDANASSLSRPGIVERAAAAYGAAVGEAKAKQDAIREEQKRAERIKEEKRFNARIATGYAVSLTPQRPAPARRPKAPTIKFDAPGKPNATEGEWVEFVYVDAEGEVTERRIRNWSQTSEYIKGFCVDRHAPRSFRLDRVESWGDWE